MFSLDSVDSNIATSRAVEVQGEQIVGQFVKPNSEFSPEIPLEEVSPQLDHSIPEALQSLDNRQIDVGFFLLRIRELYLLCELFTGIKSCLRYIILMFRIKTAELKKILMTIAI